MADDRPPEDGPRRQEDTDGVEAALDSLLDDLLGFVAALRREGAEVPANAAVDAARALLEVGARDRSRARAALRAALISRREDLDAFERLFPAFWERVGHGDLRERGYEERAGVPPPAAGGPTDGDPPSSTPGDAAGRIDPVEARAGPGAGEDTEDGRGEGSTAAYSPTGSPEPVALDPAALEGGTLAGAIERLGDAIASGRGRRWARGGRGRVAPRRALRRSLATGGAVVSLPERDRRMDAVRALFLVDVSRSVLDTVDRGFLLRFLRLAAREWRDVRVFLFDTSVREVTGAVDAPTAEAALEALERAEAGWGGGTRIGHALETVRRERPDAVDRRTTVFVVSDGLEVGEVDRLAAEMARLSRRADAVLWLNPLAASPAYEPAARGMAAALPYVDGLFAFAAPADLEELARQVERRGVGGRIGYEHDPRRRAGE